tara:strand:- start:319 stop:984 length:666 start_codon:yes stop_codon:yes gene_type:complete
MLVEKLINYWKYPHYKALKVLPNELHNEIMKYLCPYSDFKEEFFMYYGKHLRNLEWGVDGINLLILKFGLKHKLCLLYQDIDSWNLIKDKMDNYVQNYASCNGEYKNRLNVRGCSRRTNKVFYGLPDTEKHLTFDIFVKWKKLPKYLTKKEMEFFIQYVRDVDMIVDGLQTAIDTTNMCEDVQMNVYHKNKNKKLLVKSLKKKKEYIEQFKHILCNVPLSS